MQQSLLSLNDGLQGIPLPAVGAPGSTAASPRTRLSAASHEQRVTGQHQESAGEIRAAKRLCLPVAHSDHNSLQDLMNGASSLLGSDHVGSLMDLRRVLE